MLECAGLERIAPASRKGFLGRIESVEQLGMEFQPPKNDVIDTLIKEGKAFQAADPKLRVRYSPTVAQWLAETEGKPLAEDGSLTMSIHWPTSIGRCSTCSNTGPKWRCSGRQRSGKHSFGALKASPWDLTLSFRPPRPAAPPPRRPAATLTPLSLLHLSPLYLFCQLLAPGCPKTTHRLT